MSNHPPAAKAALTELREKLAACDNALLDRVAERKRLTQEVARLKSDHGLPAFDRDRESAHLESLVTSAGARGVDADVVRDLYGTLFAASRALQRAAQLEISERFSIGVIGGTSGMGQFLARIFESAGFPVETMGADRGAPAEEVAARNDVVIVAVPIHVTIDVIKKIAPRVRANACLVDVTSVKRAPLEAMMAHAPPEAGVVGTHPMFGPSGMDFDRQKVVLCRGRGDASFDRVRRLFETFGAECIESTAEEHDAQMALIQVLVHEKTMVLGSVLERLHADLGRSLQFASPIYRTELAMVGRMFSQGAELYADILTSNTNAPSYSHIFEQEAAHFARALSMGDRDAVVKRFREVALFMTDFASWAKAQSDAILHDLVRHG